jgi:maltose alpha-D-glucosyltransferase/alpha-amylase
MLLSFQYAASAVLFDQVAGVTRRPEIGGALEFWSRYWFDWVSATFLKGYFEVAAQSSLLPGNDQDTRLLLDGFMLERALEEVGRELNNRPEWARIPLRMLLRILEAPFQ